MFSQINIIYNVQNPQLSDYMKEMEKVKQAQWMNLLQIQVPGDMTPPLITENKYSLELINYHSMLTSIGLIKKLWEPFTLQELQSNAAKFSADINTPGSFDMNLSLQEIASKLLENRYITKCELILVMKCPFLAAHRLYAKQEHTCPGLDTPNPCICAYIG